jgi:hypothetical protein
MWGLLSVHNKNHYVKFLLTSSRKIGPKDLLPISIKIQLNLKIKQLILYE